MKIHHWNTKLNFGQFKGKEIAEVFDINKSYLFWALQKVDWFCLTNEVFNSFPLIKKYDEALMQFGVFGGKEFEKIIKENEVYYNHLSKIHLEKLEKLDDKIDPNNGRYLDYEYEEPNYDYDSYDDSNWLSDASGTSDPETMNDVYWNLD